MGVVDPCALISAVIETTRLKASATLTAYTSNITRYHHYTPNDYPNNGLGNKRVRVSVRGRVGINNGVDDDLLVPEVLCTSTCV